MLKKYIQKPINIGRFCTRSKRYKRLQVRFIVVALVVSVIPLLIIGGTLYFHFANLYNDTVSKKLKYWAKSQSYAVDVFLKERCAILSTIVSTHKYEYLSQQQNLDKVYQTINQRINGLIDLGVIDNRGIHVAYTGSYKLKGLDYSNQPWFNEAMLKGSYISDVFMGLRKTPHFFIAIRGYDNNARSWILRATIDPEVFNKLVKHAQTGKTGDAFILNKAGIYQTPSRFHGNILMKSDLEIDDLSEGTSITRSDERGTISYTGEWLNDNQWIMVVSQETGRLMEELNEARNVTIVTIAISCFLIFITTFFITCIIINHLEAADNVKNKINARLMHSDKLAAMGRMAAGIAHEINNPLAMIKGRVGWMKDLLDEEEFKKSENFVEYDKSISKIEDHIERMRKVIHNMLFFTRKMEPLLNNVDVNSIVEKTIELLGNHAKLNDIKFVLNLSNGLPLVASNESMLQQVLFNLISNSIDAIQRDGVVKIQTMLNDSRIEVVIEDNGPGIPEEYQGKIFDPFFTTKEVGKGTGLGLSISFDIIEKLGGSINFENKSEERGAVFTVSIPLVMPEEKAFLQADKADNDWD